MNKAILAAVPALLLAACSTNNTPPGDAPKTASSIPTSNPTPVDTKGLEAVLGKNIAALKSLFGEPRIDVREAVGRKLQFSGKACVLDAYLYANGKGGVEIVTHVDARRSDGAEVDRASCVNALMRR
ncbi:MAG: hypothetical protein V3V15_00220 [Sphingorhabdus sp.]